MITMGNLHDSHVSYNIIDPIRNFSYIFEDSDYDASDIYDYVFINMHDLAIIDTNIRRGIVTAWLLVNIRISIDLRGNMVL
jgi:hypothetical protein